MVRREFSARLAQGDARRARSNSPLNPETGAASCFEEIGDNHSEQPAAPNRSAITIPRSQLLQIVQAITILSSQLLLFGYLTLGPEQPAAPNRSAV